MKLPRFRRRFSALGEEIAAGLGVRPAPDVRIGRGRTTIRYWQLGASGWTEARRIDHAMETAAVVRSMLASSSRWAVRRRSSRAIVVIYEDALLANGCDIDARWECVVPVAADDRNR